jgi:hypothetical protein
MAMKWTLGNSFSAQRRGKRRVPRPERISVVLDARYPGLPARSIARGGYGDLARVVFAPGEVEAIAKVGLRDHNRSAHIAVVCVARLARTDEPALVGIGRNGHSLDVSAALYASDDFGLGASYSPRAGDLGAQS